MDDIRTAPSDTDAGARRNVAVLAAASAILGAQLPIHAIAGGLAGQMLAPNLCLATLPITCIIAGSVLSATPLSAAMQRFGRRAGFLAGAAAGTLGALIAALGLLLGSFALLCLGAGVTGVYTSAQGFYRMAATDTASEAFRPRAISYVLAGGLAAALFGPQLLKLTSEAVVVPFLGAYLAAAALNVAGAGLFFLLDIPRPAPEPEGSPRGRTRRELLASPRIAVAILVGTVSYALMNLMMTATPLAVVGCGFTPARAADVVSAHVFAMYAPSFFTGDLIRRFGVERIMATGLLCLAGAGAVALSGVELANFFGALVLLGIGWNFGFIGATTMLTSSHSRSEAGRAQGMNDAIVFGGILVASVASGGLLNCAGTDVREGWAAIVLAGAPLLALAGAGLLWLTLRRRLSAGP